MKAVAERGATYVNACALRLRSSARARYLPFIEQEFPHLAQRYWATYAFDHKVSETYASRLRERMSEICARHGIPTADGALPRKRGSVGGDRRAFANGEQLDFEWNESR